MNLIKLIVSIQLLLASLCLLIQLYALVSAKWAIFESRVELGNHNQSTTDTATKLIRN